MQKKTTLIGNDLSTYLEYPVRVRIIYTFEVEIGEINIFRW